MSALAPLSATPRPRTRISSLARARRWMRHAFFPASCKARLPLEGVPAGLGDIHAGGTALLLCADLDSRERLLGTLACLLESGVPEQGVTWLCAAAKAPWFMDAPLQGAVGQGRLRVLTWSEDAAAQVRTLGPAHLLRELASDGMDPRDLLIVDLIEPWMAELAEGSALEAGVAQALDCLAQWSRLHRGPILALAPTHRRGQALLPLVARSPVPRLATLRVDGARAELEVVRWGAAHRPGPRNQGARIALEIPDQGRWQGREARAYDLRTSVRAADAGRVLAVAPALHDAGALPTGWQSFDSLDALLVSAAGAIEATVLLAFERADDLPRLARVVHRLRQDHPQLLRIVVREAGAAMRQNGELALLRLGANAVVRGELGFAQLEETLADLRDETYGRTAVANPARLLQHLTPDAVQGFLEPLAFCSAVERMLERTAHTPLEHSLVHLPLLPHLSHADALHACAPRRDGDLVSVDEHGLVLFLFGCPADDAMAALDAVFAIPCSELARHVQIDPDRHAQQLALAGLQRHHARAPLAGLAEGAGLAARLREGAAAARLPVQACALPTRGAEAPRAVQHHVLPLRAATA